MHCTRPTHPIRTSHQGGLSTCDAADALRLLHATREPNDPAGIYVVSATEFDRQLAIARVLVFDPILLILDEPCEGIQPNIVAQIGDTLQKLNREDGLTVLLVEQKLPFARRVADEFRILDNGRLVAEGAIEELDDDIVQRHLSV